MIPQQQAVSWPQTLFGDPYSLCSYDFSHHPSLRNSLRKSSHQSNLRLKTLHSRYFRRLPESFYGRRPFAFSHGWLVAFLHSKPTIYFWAFAVNSSTTIAGQLTVFWSGWFRGAWMSGLLVLAARRVRELSCRWSECFQPIGPYHFASSVCGTHTIGHQLHLYSHQTTFDGPWHQHPPSMARRRVCHRLDWYSRRRSHLLRFSWNVCSYSWLWVFPVIFWMAFFYDPIDASHPIRLYLHHAVCLHYVRVNHKLFTHPIRNENRGNK